MGAVATYVVQIRPAVGDELAPPEKGRLGELTVAI